MEWDPNKTLDLYIHDYMVKKNMQTAAETFMAEAEVPNQPVAIEAPEGFLSEWWSIFYDIFTGREQKNLENKEAYAMTKAQQSVNGELQQFHLSRVHPLVQSRVDHISGNGIHSLSGLPIGMNLENVPAPHPSCLFNTTMVEEHLKHRSVRDHHRRMQQEAFLESQQQVESKNGAYMGRSLPAETLLYGVTKGMLPRSRFCEAGLSKGANPLPLNGRPLAGIDQIYPVLGQHLLESFLKTPNQLQQLLLSTPQHQQAASTQLWAEPNASLVSSFSAKCMEMDPQSILDRSDFTSKARPSCSQQLVSSIQTTSEMVGPTPIDETLVRRGLTTDILQVDRLPKKQVQENNRKRKLSSDSGAGSSILVGTTVCPSLDSFRKGNHIPSKGVQVPGALSESHDTSEKQKIYCSDGFNRLVEASTQMDDVIDKDDVSLNDNVESFLSHDDDDNTGDAPFSALQDDRTNTDGSKGFSLTEVGCLRSSTSKVVCCHFSSDGKLLASAGHDKKVTVWNMDTFDFWTTSEEHSLLITDIRFKPSSTLLATSSFDKTVKVWNAADPSCSLYKLVGHQEHVMSLDFHPKKGDLLCSCDGYGEIRWWNINRSACIRVSKGAMRQVRIQPEVGHYLAAAAGNIVNIIDVETDQLRVSLKGHSKEVTSICWLTSGEYMASASEDSVRIWSASDWKCIHQMKSSGNKFQSCTFHPQYPLLLVIGTYQSLEVWEPMEGKTMTYPAAHGGMVSSLSNSPSTGMLASTSHDQCVKLWK